MIPENHANAFFLNPPHLVWTGRGTTALWAILKALNPDRTRVLVPVNVCEVVVAAIYHAGMKPVYHDVDAQSGNASLDHVQAAWDSKVGVWIAVHNYGSPTDLAPMMNWARSKQLFVIEDVCNAFGATVNGKPVGAIGDAAFYSFGNAKIVEVGQGGALSLSDLELRDAVKQILATLPIINDMFLTADGAFQTVLRTIRANAITQKPPIYRAFYREYMPYLLFRADEQLIQSVMAKIALLPKNIRRRRAKAERYRQALTLPLIQHRPLVEGDVYWRYCFFVPECDRDHLLKALRLKHVPASAWFPPVNVFFEEATTPGQYPGAEAFARQVINLWVNDQVDDADIDQAVNIIRNFFQQEE